MDHSFLLERAEAWLDPSIYDQETITAVRRIMTSPEELADAFFSDLSFGTGGVRGVMGVGTNRINFYTIRRVTQGLANYILKKGSYLKGVVIGFDSRHHSKSFAQETAKVFTGNGIPVFFLNELRPTPYISFSCRYLKAQAAVMITASHNPKEYNGYKVYWEDGGQVVSPHDTEIMSEVDAVVSPYQVRLSSSIDNELVVIPGPPLDEAYFQAIEGLQLFPGKQHQGLKISYTSLHGTGITLLPAALVRFHFLHPHLVAGQAVPDGDFPTVRFPNPEYPEALKLGVEDLLITDGDILLATDPDCDRLGVVAKHRGKAVILTGNELATLGAYFICKTLSEQKKLPDRGAIVSTIVTTELLKKICEAFGVHYVEVLTGFKYIGEKIHQWEQDRNGYVFLFGAEESYGYLMGTYTRDKDGIIAGCLFAQIASMMQKEGRTMIDLLHEIYKKFGIYRESQLALTFSAGKSGLDTLHASMKNFRKNLPLSLGGERIVTVRDYLKPTSDGLPSSDILLFRLEDGSKVVIRPSGTETKLKVYVSAHLKNFSSVEEGYDQCDERLEKFTTSIKTLFL